MGGWRGWRRRRKVKGVVNVAVNVAPTLCRVTTSMTHCDTPLCPNLINHPNNLDEFESLVVEQHQKAVLAHSLIRGSQHLKHFLGLGSGLGCIVEVLTELLRRKGMRRLMNIEASAGGKSTKTNQQTNG